MTPHGHAHLRTVSRWRARTCTAHGYAYAHAHAWRAADIIFRVARVTASTGSSPFTVCTQSGCMVCADLRRDSLGDGLCKRPDDLTGGATMQCAPAQAGHTHAVSGRWHSLCARVGMAMYREDSSRQCALCVRAMRRS